MDKFSKPSPTTVNPKGVIELNYESFAPSKKIMLLTNEDCGTTDTIIQPIKNIVKIEK